MMSQEEIDCFPQGRFPEFRHRLRVFFDSHMKRIIWRENPPCRHEAFQFRRGHRFDCLGIICQFTENLFCNSLRLCPVSKVLLNTPAPGIICKLVPSDRV
jgi:hypothetical protein